VVIGAPPEMPPPINSEEEAIAWMRELIEQATQARDEVNVPLPQVRDDVVVRWQRRRELIFFVRYGSALGVLMGLYRTGKISLVAYAEWRQELSALLAPTQVGVIRPPHGL